MSLEESAITFWPTQYHTINLRKEEEEENRRISNLDLKSYKLC